mgnify:CR=1 FL=1
MRRLFDWVVMLAIVGAVSYGAYTHQPELAGVVRLVQNQVSPCSTPLTYSIGAVDKKFGIPRDILIADLKDAEGIWEKAAGRELFEYQETGGAATVNLVYDSRQASTDRLKSLGIQVDQSRDSYDALTKRYDALNALVDGQRAKYDVAVAAYSRDEAAYGAEVDRWNSQGGAPKAVYAQLQQQQVALKQAFESVKQLETTMNANIDTVNALATVINQLIVQLNINVDQYNQVGAGAGSFEEGLYELSGVIQTITIFEYSGHISLVRVLAHEMGHAIGLDHVEENEAIMYKLNEGKGLKATAADITELKSVCHIQ